jgi:ATP phosphoribosyltransferase regulatory subunit
MNDAPWLLPVGIDDLLPESAAAIEMLRRDLLDLFRHWGYDLVEPPFVEYLESLLVGAGSDLDLQTCKLIDQLSGRMLGIRADMTPQAARMDAHALRREAPTRLCYLGTVLRTLPDGLASSRNPLQIGAELFGHAGIESDVEILRLMLRTLERVGVTGVYLDLGHVGIFRNLARQAGLDAGQEARLFAALQRKDLPEIEEMLEEFPVPAAQGRMLRALVDLDGEDALERAQMELGAAGASVQEALRHVRRVAEALRGWLPELPLHFDLGELRGYHFHTGIVFAAFAPGSGQEVARGGRYDGIGLPFGQARPATGFSADLKTLVRLSPHANARAPDPGVFAPCSTDPRLYQEIERLRDAGIRVVAELPGQRGGGLEMGCDHELRLCEGAWQLVAI